MTNSSEISFNHFFIAPVSNGMMIAAVTHGFYRYQSADFTPDGKQLIITGNRDSLLHPDRSLESEIYLCNLNGSNLQKLLGEKGKQYNSPKISPSGKWLAFQFGNTSFVDVPQLAVMPINGTGKDIQVLPFDRNKGGLVWSADEQWIYFTAQSNGGQPLYRINISSKKAEALSDFNTGILAFDLYKNQLELIGGIDPESEKEFNETKERFDFLSNQTNDLNSAVKSLEKIISELDINIKERFDHEFDIISEKFSEYFKILFNGGSAKIFKLTEEEKVTTDNSTEIKETSPSEDSLKKVKLLKKRNALGLSGIEIQATPPGKKIQTISMLSGGERALTAIALICAIISANPSPFVVLDEVDAALDEANSERLAQILDDLSNKTQFIVITHNRASMKRASVLYGVTMQSDGVSKLLSVKLEEVSSRQDPN